MTTNDPAALVRDVLAARPAAGARLIRWLEDGDPRGRAALRNLFHATGRAHLVGITGPPGGGKSTLVDALIGEYRRLGRRVGVVAVDPTSPYSGGAVLGDRVRMQRHAGDDGVFIRSMATRGQLGGLARATYDAALVLDAMGYDPVLVETVGVGQDEVDVALLAHTTVIVCVPGLGDEIQAIKAGVLEAGQVFVINKADRPGCLELRRQLELMLHLRSDAAPDAWQPPLLVTTASRGEGTAELAAALERHRQHLHATLGFGSRIAERGRRILLAELRRAAAERIMEHAPADPEIAALLDGVDAQRLDPYTVVDALIARFVPVPPATEGPR